jgi:hypothetical protein
MAAGDRGFVHQKDTIFVTYLMVKHPIRVIYSPTLPKSNLFTDFLFFRPSVHANG